MHKTRKILALALSLALLLGLLSVGTLTATANIPAANRGIIFPYLFTSEGAGSWIGLNQTDAHFDIDVTVPAVHNFELPGWPSTQANWITNNTKVMLLLPTGTNALPVSVERMAIAGRTAVTNRNFAAGGSFYNSSSNPSPLFGNVNVGTGYPAAVPGFSINQMAITDISPAFDVDEWSQAGPSPTMGEINHNDVITLQIRVGERPPPPPVRFGDADGNGMVDARDVTLLRRFIAATSRADFEADNTINVTNADANGNDLVNSADVTLLRRHIASGGEIPLGPPRRPIGEGYFIAVTADDGPKAVGTPDYLNVASYFNDRDHVVCGQNPEMFGVLPCRPGVGCGRVCGTQSRVHLSFYVNGGNNSLMEAWNAPQPGAPLLQRMAAEGHEIANHTTSHQATTGMSSATIRNEIITTDERVHQHLTLDLEASDFSWGGVGAVFGSFTDFYGRTYSGAYDRSNLMRPNQFRSRTFRPGFFSIGSGASGVDQNFFGPGEHLPWIFAGLDVDDWRGHSGREMADFILNGTHRPCPRHGSAWCSIGTNGTQHAGVRNVAGSADGGNILLHDGTGAWAAGRDMMNIIIPEMQELGYHFVTVEHMFEFMDAEFAFVPPSVRPGSGDGTRVNDWTIRGARRAGPIFPSVVRPG